jgi:hypothetical protein
MPALQGPKSGLESRPRGGEALCSPTDSTHPLLFLNWNFSHKKGGRSSRASLSLSLSEYRGNREMTVKEGNLIISRGENLSIE